MPCRIDWLYRRNGCQTCQRADAYFEKIAAQIAQQLDARRQRIGPAEALKMARAADHLWVARGQSFLYFNMKQDAPSDAELQRLLIGPSGNLRAPTFRRGKTLVAGFHPKAYGKVLES